MNFKKIIAVIASLAGGMLFFAGASTRCSGCPAESILISNASVGAGMILLMLGVLELIYVFGKKVN